MPQMHPEDLDVAELKLRAARFRETMAGLKRSISLAGAHWYPYDTLSCWDSLDRLLTGDNRRLLSLTGRGPIADIGCADGELSFFLESLGCPVHAMDNPATNHNRMAGIGALKTALGSSVTLETVDLDTPFGTGETRYGLCFFLGVLYHLKNPMWVLEQLARTCRYCLLSTRIAAVGPNRRTDISHLPVAYLVDESETNNDATNYWIFTDAGLRRALKRTGWTVCDHLYTGTRRKPDPVHDDADGRVFCLVKSRYATPPGLRLLEGWHAAEHGNWRWTEKRFGMLVQGNPAGKILRFRFTIPPAVIASLGSVSLHAAVEGRELPARTYAEPGDHVYSQPLPFALADAPIQVHFELDRALPPGTLDERELGVVVSFDADAPTDPRFPITFAE